MAKIPLPERGQPLDVTYIYQLAETINDLSTQLSSATYKTTSIDTFKKLFESNIESSIKKSFFEIENKIKEDINTNIMKQIRGDCDGDDKYNYSLIPKIKINSVVDCPLQNYSNLFDKPSEKFKQFMIMKDNEKIVLSIGNNNLLLTNYGKVWCFDNQIYVQRDEHKFWIPIDFINICRILTNNISFINKRENYHNNGMVNDYSDIKSLYTNINKLLTELKLELESIRKEKEKFIKVNTQSLEEYIQINLEQSKHFETEKKKSKVDILLEKYKIKEKEYIQFNVEKECVQFNVEKDKLQMLILKYKKKKLIFKKKNKH